MSVDGETVSRDPEPRERGDAGEGRGGVETRGEEDLAEDLMARTRRVRQPVLRLASGSLRSLGRARAGQGGRQKPADLNFGDCFTYARPSRI
jgi:uncharacterized protein with PIN domain